MFKTLIAAFTALLFALTLASAERPSFSWRNVEKGFDVARYALSGEQFFLKSEVLLLRFDPNLYSFSNVLASEIGDKKRTSIEEFGEAREAVAAINTSFFDKKEEPLGLIVERANVLNKVHSGGNLLTGILVIVNNKPSLLHRDSYSFRDEDLAVQAGPRLIQNGKLIKIKTDNTSTRRSGIAITRKGEIIIYATLLRFPGSTFAQLQEMLSDPRLQIKDALNLDGGGSSQLFIRKNKALESDTVVSGGDTIPTALVVTKKKGQSK